MVFEQVITPDDGEGVAPHPHDATDVSGEATLITLRVNRLLAGTIKGKEIIVSGGTDGIIRSDNYAAGSDGWSIVGDGSAEFSDITVRGTVGTGGALESPNFVSGSTGWQIAGDGSAEFQNVTVRGSINADDIDAGSLDVDRITAKSLSLGKLQIGSVDNLIQDPGFEQASTISGSVHSFVDSGGTWEYFVGHASARSGGNFVRYDPAGQSGLARIRFNGVDVINNHPFVAEGDGLYLEFYANRDTTGTTNAIKARVDWYDESGSFISANGGTAVTTPIGYTKVSVSATAPAGAAFAVLQAVVENDGNSTPIRFDDVYARRQVGSVIFEADLQSDNFSSGSAGWQIKRDTGDAEFNDGTFRGTLTAAKYQTAISGERIEIDPGFNTVNILWYNSGGSNIATIAGGSQLDINAEGTADLGLSSLGGDVLVDANVDLTLRADNSNMSITLDASAGHMRHHFDGVFIVDCATATAGQDAFYLRSNVGGADTTNLIIDADGDVTNTNNSYGGISDKRLKKNIKTARSYLDDLRKVRVTTHTLKSTDKKLLGPIAQELREVFPGLVSEREDGYLSVKHSVFVPMLITAIQELAEDRDALVKRLDELEGNA